MFSFQGYFRESFTYYREDVGGGGGGGLIIKPSKVINEIKPFRIKSVSSFLKYLGLSDATSKIQLFD